MPENPSFQEVDGLFRSFHSELETIVMDMLGDKVSYNLLSCVFIDLDETQEEYLRARRRRGFSRPLIFVVVIVASVFVLSLFFRVENIQVEGNTH